MSDYDSFAQTFSHSRKHLHWPELDTLIETLHEKNIQSVLDIGCGNGRFLDFAGDTPIEYLGIDSSAGMIIEAQKLHPGYQFLVGDMLSLGDEALFDEKKYGSLIFLASFHHLKTPDERTLVLELAKKRILPHGRVFLTNWNLREQSRYDHMGNEKGDYQIKIGKHERYYHGFHLEEMREICQETGWNIEKNYIFPGGRNIYTELTLE